MTTAKTKAARKSALRAPSANAQAASLANVGAVAYDIGHKGAGLQKDCDAAIAAAIKGCASPARFIAIANEFKLHFAAATMATISNNLPIEKRIAAALAIRAMAPGPVMKNGKIIAPTGNVKKGQKRRTLEQHADYVRCYQVNAAKFLSRSFARLGIVTEQKVGAKSAASKKAAADKAMPPEKGAVIALAKVAKFMPPSRKQMTPTTLAAYLVQQGATMLAVVEEAVQSFDKSGTQTSGLLGLSSAVSDYREAVNKAAANFA